MELIYTVNISIGNEVCWCPLSWSYTHTVLFLVNLEEKWFWSFIFYSTNSNQKKKNEQMKKILWLLIKLCIIVDVYSFSFVPGLYSSFKLYCRTKVAACAKHFVGDGGTTKGVNENNTLIDWHGLLSIHMPAYSDSILKGVATVMVSYSSWNGMKMHANRDLVSGFLKDTLKFKVIDTLYSFFFT